MRAGRISLATLIESTIGLLSVQLIEAKETHPADMDDEALQERLIRLKLAIDNAVSPEKRMDPEVIEKLQIILKSIKITAAPWFWIFLYRKWPSLWDRVASDELIQARMAHIRLVGDIGECFSEDNLLKLDGGIVGARKRVFEMSNKPLGDVDE